MALRVGLGIAAVFAISLPGATLAQSDATLPTIRVAPAAPVTAGRSGPAAPGRPARAVPPGAVEVDRIPEMVDTVTADDVSRTHSTSATEVLQQRVPGVNLQDVQGNGFFQDLRYRGFAASPLQGTPQGLAVYVNGMRFNEAFGDTVNWDLIPAAAIDRADVWSANPVFGLNALGGTVSVQLKNGFSYRGASLELQGGSFGRASGSVQYGGRKDNVAVYVAAEGLSDRGWRYQSPSRIRRFYGDVGWQANGNEIHVSAGAASNFFGVIGPTPVQMLAQDYKSIYTWPQTTKNKLAFGAVNGKFDLGGPWSMQTGFYVRKFRQKHDDGNDADIEDCDPPLAGTLCLDDDGFPGQPPGSSQILDSSGAPIPFIAGTPYGTVDRTSTKAQVFGGSVQFTNDAKLFGHGNSFIAGASIDHGRIRFDANSELGYIYPDLFVGPNGAVPGTGSQIQTAANIGYAPVMLNARNTYYGLYARDTFDITKQLSVTAGGRLNVAQISMADQLGNSPDLNGSHSFSRFNPLIGLAYMFNPRVSAHAVYSESNRAPTPLELGCANPMRPCLLEGFLVADPPLQQVVSRTVEAGLRGNAPLAGGRLEWKLALFRTDSSNDIIRVASAIPGRGVFQNVDATRRQGLEASAEIKSGPWSAFLSYSYLDATYQFTGNIASPNNPSADTDGNILVTPGKTIPGIPRHQFKARIDYAMTPDWIVGGNVIAVGSQYYVGDDANQNDKLPAYWVANLHTSYQVTKTMQVFGLVNNLFNQRYSTFGTYFEPGQIVNALANPPTDPRMQTPAQPLSVYVGARVRI
ncbi:MAG: TonB-dependent receptor [Xanthobacteraceae bacterium]|nr:TonB-dependent receptor [Xanthobacteraceae bacterium]